MSASDKPTGLGGPEGLEPSGLHPADAIPRAAEDLILGAVKRGLQSLSDPTMNWQEYHRRLQRTPELVLHELRETKVLFRLPEQADWPLVIEAFERRPYTLTIRTQMTIGGQTFGCDQQSDHLAIYTAIPYDLAAHQSRQAIRATLEAVAAPFYEQAHLRFASAIEAQRAKTGNTGLAACRESAVAKPDAQRPS